MERDAGGADADAERDSVGLEPPAFPRAPGNQGGNVLILAAEPGADPLLRTTVYGPPVRPAGRTGGRSPESLALYLLRLLSGVLIGGAAMLATTRWTHLDASV